MPRSWKAEFQVVNDPVFYDNAIRFATETEATFYAANKLVVWTAAVDSRVVESDDPPNYAWSNATGLLRLPEEKTRDAG